MGDTGTTSATWKGTVDGRLPKNQRNKLLVEAEAYGLTLNDLAATCEEFGVAPCNLLNELSIAVAEGYLAGALTYEFCDGVMNGLIAAIVDVGMTNDMPQPAFSIYQAFDQGEWGRHDDPPEIDTIEKYVKPLVVQIVREFQGGSGYRPEAELICHDTDDELVCEIGCKNMITTVNQDDCLTYFVVVHGVDVETYERMAVHFECRRGGMRPKDKSRYISIPVTMATLGGTLAWVKTELDGRYCELDLIVCVAAKLSWSEVVITAEIALLAGQAHAAIKVAFSN